AIARRIHGGRVAAVEQELGGLNVFVALAAAFDIVHKAAEAHERLFHLLVTVVPGLLRRGAEMTGPAVGQAARRVVEAGVFFIGHLVVIDGGFEEVAAGVALVVGAVGRIPVLKPAALDDAAASVFAIKRERRLQVSVGLLRGEDDGN